jgi:glycosyltransferase involved in cell wall biosynthesis
MKIPATIYCAHGWSFNMETSAIRKYIYKIVERLLAYRTDAIVNISHSEHSTAIAAGIAPTKCVMIYNGIRRTPLAVDPPKTDKIKLLFVGRLDKQKGYDLLCEAIREIGSIEYHLTVIGERVVDAKPKFHVGSSSVVTELGWQSPEVIAAHMQASDIVIMPSRWEGFGYVAIEAMREGRGVMGTAVGGLREIIVNDETGFLIPPNDLNALKKAILQLREVDLRKIGRAARKRFEEKFTADETFMNLDTLYRKVLQRSSHENTAY